MYVHIKRTARANRECELVRAVSESVALDDVSIADGLHATEPYTYVPPYQYPTLPLPLVLSLSLRLLRLLFRTVASEAQRPCVISRPPFSPFFPSSFLLLLPLSELLLCGTEVAAAGAAAAAAVAAVAVVAVLMRMMASASVQLSVHWPSNK